MSYSSFRKLEQGFEPPTSRSKLRLAAPWLIATSVCLALAGLAQAQKATGLQGATTLPKGTAVLEANTKLPALTVTKPYLVKVSHFAVSGGSNPGDTVTLTMTLDASGDGTRDVPWSFSNAGSVFANGTASALSAGKSVTVSATYRLPNAESVLHFQGAVDAQNTLKEPDGERGNNVSQVVDVGVHLAAAAAVVGNNAVSAGAINATNAVNTGTKVVGGVVVGSADAAATGVKTGTQAVTGGLTPPKGGTIDLSTKTPNTGVTAVATNGVKTGALTPPSGGTIDLGSKTPGPVTSSPDQVKHVVDTTLRTTTGPTSGVGPKLIDGGKNASSTVVATAGTTVTNTVTTLTAYEASLGSLVQVHLDSGTARADASSATLDGGVTLTLKSNAAAKLRFNGHLVLRGAAAMPSANEAAALGNGSAALANATAKSATTPGGTGAFATQAAGPISAGVAAGTTAASRSWATIEGSGNVALTMGSYSVGLAGNRTVSGNSNGIFISGASVDIAACTQDANEFRLDNTGLAMGGKLRCGALALENSNIKVSPTGQMSGSGSLNLFDHSFNFNYDLSGGGLKAQQTASWPASAWMGVAGVAEYRVTGPSVTVAINGASVSRTFSTGGVESRSTAQNNGKPWSSASLPSANFALGADNSVRLSLPSLPQPTDALKSTRDACKKAADDAYSRASMVPGAANVRDAAKRACDADSPSPPSIGNVPGTVSAAVSSLLSGAARDAQAAVQTAASNASTTAGQAAATGRQLGANVQNGINAGANTAASAVGSGVITAGNNIATYGEDNYGGQVSYSPRTCDAPIGIALAAPPSQKKAAEAAARNCIVKASTANGFFWARVDFTDHCGSTRTDQTCLTELNMYQAAEDGQTAGRQIGETIALGFGWDQVVRDAAKVAATKVINACAKVANGDVTACTSRGGGAGIYVGGGTKGGQTGGTGLATTGNSPSPSGCTAVPDGHGGLHYPAGCSSICRAGYVKVDQVRCVKKCYPPEHNITDDLCGSDNSTTSTPPAEETCGQPNTDGTCMHRFCNAGRIDVGGQCVDCNANGDIIRTNRDGTYTCEHHPS